MMRISGFQTRDLKKDSNVDLGQNAEISRFGNTGLCRSNWTAECEKVGLSETTSVGMMGQSLVEFCTSGVPRIASHFDLIISSQETATWPETTMTMIDLENRVVQDASRSRDLEATQG